MKPLGNVIPQLRHNYKLDFHSSKRVLSMDIDLRISHRITQCHQDSRRYESWLGKLGPLNLFTVGLGSLLSFLGGAEIIASTQILTTQQAGIMALVGGALTGIHGWLKCDDHQSECRRIANGYKSFQTKYEKIQLEPQKDKKLERLNELEDDFAGFEDGFRAVPWTK